jgi:hypothetical protein
MSTDPFTLRVECEAGLQGEQTPRRLFMADKAVEIEDILDRWLAPEYDYFKVCDAGKNIYILRHDKSTRRWELTLFQSGKCQGDPSR